MVKKRRSPHRSQRLRASTFQLCSELFAIEAIDSLGVGSRSSSFRSGDALQKDYPDRIAYFPAYEILMDELRDYRFYADDMLHPSPLAIDYIWGRFTENFLSTDTSAILKEWGDIQKAINHKPFQPDSEAYKRFILQTLLKMERISEKNPSFDIAKEIEYVKAKMRICQ